MRSIRIALTFLVAASSVCVADPVKCGGHVQHESTTRATVSYELPKRVGSASLQYILGVRYTPSAASKVGGVTHLNTQLREAVAGANSLLSGSGINVEIVLAYSAQTVSDENTSCTDCDALNKQHRPDAFALVEETGLGYANIPTSVSQALGGARLLFGVSNFKQNTLAHEVGHSLGLYHGSRESIDTTIVGTPSTSIIPDYGVGVVARGKGGGEFHTIMSYGNLTNTSTPSGFFSSPNLSFAGVPTGTEEANAVKAANFWAQYVTIAGERMFPLPISLTVRKDGRNTTLEGKCLEEVAGNPSVGTVIELAQKDATGTVLALSPAECDENGLFSLSLDSSLSGTFRATHTKLSQDTEWVEPYWTELSLFGKVADGRTFFSGVCFDQKGTAPRAGEEVEIVYITSNEYKTVAEATCSAEGTYSAELSRSQPGKYEAQIPGEAYSGIVEVLKSDGGSAGSGSCNAKKLKKLKKKRKKSSSKTAKKRLKKKIKALKKFC